MALKTILEQLEEVQDAITKTLNSQRYKTSSVEMQKALLSDLTNREESLLNRYRKYGDIDIATQKTNKAVANVRFY